MLKAIIIPLVFYAINTAVMTENNTLSSPETFKQTQKKNSRVKAAYAEKESLLKEELEAAGFNLTNFNMLIVSTKQERNFHIYLKKKGEKKYQLFKTYEFCYLSGILGPKRKEGDLQVPEGFYYVNWFNPNSDYHLSFKINYPNASDKILSDKKTPGGEIFIHGKCVSIGCIPLTDDYINEVYILAVEATNNGQSKIPVYIYPFEMTQENMDVMDFLVDDSMMSFWNNLKEGYDTFLQDNEELKFTVDKAGKYIF
jgi:murein L,D-transpeptidase YafK